MRARGRETTRTMPKLASLISIYLLLFGWVTRGLVTGHSFNTQSNFSIQDNGARVKRRASKSANLLPKFSSPIGNTTAVVGRDVRLVCTIENLGQYQVAWLREETGTILSIDTNIIITNYRIFLIPDEEGRKWVLHIKDVQESDRGFYQCQVNTKPMRSTSGYLEVVVPPAILESQSSQVAETLERGNVSLQCKANGHPRPTITWRRDDGQPIKLAGHLRGQSSFRSEQQMQQNSPVIEANGGNLNLSLQNVQNDGYNIASTLEQNRRLLSNANQVVDQQPVGTQLTDIKSDKLDLYDVDRTMGGVYVCTASNGIPSQESKRIPLYVKFAPKTFIQNKFFSVNLGDPVEIECLIEAFPKPRSHWAKRSPSSALHLPPPRGASGAARWSRLLGAGEQSAPSLQVSELTPVPSQWTVASTSENLTSDSITSIHVPTGYWWLTGRVQKRRSLQGDLEPEEDFSERETEGDVSSTEFRTNLAAASYRQLSSPLDLGEESNVTPSFKSLTSDSRNSEKQDEEEKEPQSQAVRSVTTSTNTRAYVTVKQTALNSYTYLLKMSISRMHLEDFGQYTCVASNAMGESESSIAITRADRYNQRTKAARQPSIEPVVNQRPGSGELDYYQRDSLNSRPYVHLPIPSPGSGQMKDSARPRGGSSGSSSGAKVYDENYLQAIKTRQNNLAVSGKLQQKLKSTHFSDKNSACSPLTSGGQILTFTAITLAATTYLMRHEM